jgi:hypothetical protein
MKTRAIAVASERSNAVGTVELECVPQGLVVTYLGVASFAEGYAPGALTRDTQVLVPWAGVAEAALEGDRLFLQVDARVTPHHCMLLANFSAADAPHPAQLQRQRAILRFGLAVAFVLVVISAGVASPMLAPRAGAALVVAIGLTAAFLLLGAGIVAEHRLARGNATAEAARLIFAAELARYLPHLAVSQARPARTTLTVPTLDSVQALLPRSTAAIVITLTAGLLGAILTSSWVIRERDRPAPRPVAMVPPPPSLPASPADPSEPVNVAQPPPATAAAAPAPVPSGAPPRGPCVCYRSDSVLWQSPLPRLSTVLIERKERPHKDHVHLELELGVVNNGHRDIGEVNLLVQFYERRPPDARERTATYDRPLFFEGPLRPGQAIKWHVEARGTEFDVHHAVEGTLDPNGTEAAPPDAFAALLDANHRPVRLHGAMMLAYLGDERAQAGALRLRDALREDEGPYLGRLLRATSDVITCDVEATGKSRTRVVNACVFNRSGEPKDGLFVRGRALDRAFDHRTPLAAPPIVIAEATLPLEGAVPAGSGVRVTIPLDTENPDGLAPVSFEAFAGTEREIY